MTPRPRTLSRRCSRSLVPVLVAACGATPTAGTGGVADGGASSTGPIGAATTSAGDTADDAGTQVDAASGAADSSGGAIKLDVGAAEDSGGPGACGCGGDGFSFLWAANSAESTVSKINTETVLEEGRYLTRADGYGNPSRTSVSIDGRAVVVANRATGLVKIWARPEDCVERNGVLGIQTSSGAVPLAWGEDECVAWYVDFMARGRTVQRPVAWSSGAIDPVRCDYPEQKVWTVAGRDPGGSFNGCGAGGGDMVVYRLDGETGVVEDEIPIDPAIVPCYGSGAYGSAVDGNGDYWFFEYLPTNLGGSKVVRVDGDTLAYEAIAGGQYGFTVDAAGRVWTSSSTIHRYDPVAATWDAVDAAANAYDGGLAPDAFGRVWFPTANEGGPALQWVDADTLAVGTAYPVPHLPKGVSVDIHGFVWGVSEDGFAMRVDPDTGDVVAHGGLSSPYTYSDMTGGQLAAVTCEPAG